LATGSRPVLGSSKNYRLGPPISEFATQSLRLLPPLSFSAMRPLKFISYILSSKYYTIASISSLSRPLIRANSSKCSRGVSCGHRQSFWGQTPTSSKLSQSAISLLRKRTCPDVFARCRVMMLKVLDFPAPFFVII
jgi:hypothetical protein